MKVKNPVSQQVRIFPKINQKKDMQNRKAQAPASVRNGMEAISLWHC